MTFKENILEVYRRASDSDLLVGRLWYRSAREIASQLATRYNLTLEQKEAALEAGVRVSEMQAVTWVCYRREKGITD